jgi:hypothetical protein
MRLHLALALLLAGCSGDSTNGSAAVHVEIASDHVLATVDVRYLSVAVDSAQLVGGDFWNAAATVNGMEPIAALDFGDPRLRRLARELAPAYLRLGGTDADRIYYDLSSTPVTQPPAPYRWLLTRALWEGAADFAGALDFQILFTLNAGPGPRDASGRWLPDQADALLRYAASRHDPVAVWELGNEVNAYPIVFNLTVSPVDYARDFAAAQTLISSLTPGARLAGPASAYWPIVGEAYGLLPRFVAAAGDGVNLVTWHYYPQQSRRCPARVRPAGVDVLLDADNLDEIDRWADQVATSVMAHSPAASVWLDETGNAQCGGEPGVSDVFVSGFWWLDQLGKMARRGTPVVVRQSLVGANYGLLAADTLEPRPDYWNSVLWRRLMDHRVLDASAHLAPADPPLRTYAHCTPARPGAVTLVALNLAKTARSIDVPQFTGAREIYRLDATSLVDPVLRLNGAALHAGADGAPPEMTPVVQDGGTIDIAPLSYLFIVFPAANAAACP